jgi:hypothetical protein
MTGGAVPYHERGRICIQGGFDKQQPAEWLGQEPRLGIPLEETVKNLKLCCLLFSEYHRDQYERHSYTLR